VTCYIVIYDAEQKESEQKIVHVIKEYETHSQICNTAWGVVTDEEATDIRDKLKKVITEKDRIFVIKSGSEAGWAHVLSEKSWLHKYLMNEY
jgi:CRISPR/Cas system-associated endoribonuclease Cas2